MALQYSEGRAGRVFVLRLDDGEDLMASIERFVIEKKIESAMIHILGALREGRIVTGPEKPVIPPTPHFEPLADGWEMIGLGTVYPSEEGPKIHLHASFGREKAALTGCLRGESCAFLILEAVVLEIVGTAARRERDERTGLHLLIAAERKAGEVGKKWN